jgi:hypothetical protein
VTEEEGEEAGALVRAQRGDQRPHDALARPPGDMEARHGVSGDEVAALRPVDRREEADAAPDEVAPDPLERLRDVRFGPPARPDVVAAEIGVRHPVAESEGDVVLDPHQTLLRRAHEEEAPERHLCEAAEAVLARALEQDDLLLVVAELERGDDPGDPAPDHHCIAHVSRRNVRHVGNGYHESRGVAGEERV